MQQTKVQARPKIHAGSIELNRPNIPVPPTALIGRREELAFALNVLSDPSTRLLTLTGPGGVGKTRLSLEIAHSLAHAFSDGVSFVSLAPVNDPTLVIASVAATLGLREDASSSLFERLKNTLRDRHRLLVLDNFEQVISAAPLVVELLSAAPELRVLVSSRAPLRVRGERELPLSPLALPDARQPLHPNDQQQLEAAADSMALFVQAAQGVDPRFELTEENAQTVAEICIRLDGLPLAIELAAARVRMLPLKNILSRLDNRLGLLTGGARDLPARQQTLRDAIAWSYDLLEEHERKVFRRMGVFSGGCTLEAAEEVCALAEERSIDMLETISSLVEKSVLRRQEDGGESRLLMLETIREFALGLLAQNGEEEAIRLRHARCFTDLAEKGMVGLTGKEMKEWLRIYASEHDNFRSALRWLLDSGRGAMALALAGAIGRFWLMHAHLSEGRRWMEEALAAAPEDPASEPRARVLNHHGNTLAALGDLLAAQKQYEKSLEIYRHIGKLPQVGIVINNLGNVALALGDVARARDIYEQSLAIRRELGDRTGIATVLNNLGNILHVAGEYERSRALYEESLEIARELGDKRKELFSLTNLGILHHSLGHTEQSEAMYDEALELARELEDRRAQANLLNHMGRISHDLDRSDDARRLHTESLALAEEIGDRNGMALSQFHLGSIAHALGEPVESYTHLRAATELMMEIGDRISIQSALEGIARVLAGAGHGETAATLMGAAAALQEATGTALEGNLKARHDAAIERMRESMSDESFRNGWNRGIAMSLEDAVELATAVDPASLEGSGRKEEISSAPQTGLHAQAAPPAPVTDKLSASVAASLTPRELEILRLVAGGLADAEIGERLSISTRTVNAHLRSIYAKLDVPSRREAARKAAAIGIV